MEFDKLFKINITKFLLIIAAFFVSVVLHNFISAIFGIEEALFFIIAVLVIPFYFIISMAYTIYIKIGGN